MVKRKPLSYDDRELVNDMRKSTGRGIDALFSENNKSKPCQDKAKTKDKKVSNITSNIASKQASKQAILQFTEDEINELKEPAYKGQTYRLTDQEIEWLKDTAYRLNKESKKTRVTQVDLVRISFKMFEKSLKNNKAEIIKLIERIK